MGTIKVELYEDKAPITVKNFLGYVDDKFYDGTIFHRVIPDFMIQGGGFEPGMKEKKTKDADQERGGQRPVEQRAAPSPWPAPPTPTAPPPSSSSTSRTTAVLDREKASDGVGYCVFGKVIEGMDVVDKIKDVKTRQHGRPRGRAGRGRGHQVGPPGRAEDQGQEVSLVLRRGLFFFGALAAGPGRAANPEVVMDTSIGKTKIELFEDMADQSP